MKMYFDGEKETLFVFCKSTKENHFQNIDF